MQTNNRETAIGKLPCKVLGMDTFSNKLYMQSHCRSHFGYLIENLDFIVDSFLAGSNPNTNYTKQM